MATRAEAIKARFQSLTNTIWPAYESKDLTTTFSLYRRAATSAKSDLGSKTLTWEPVADAQDFPCVILGLALNDVRWELDRQGQRVDERIVLHTAYEDIREGDQLILALDDRAYFVENSLFEGGLRVCQINRGKVQAFTP